MHIPSRSKSALLPVEGESLWRMEHICIVTQAGLNEAGSIDLLPDMDDETRVGIGESVFFRLYRVFGEE